MKTSNIVIFVFISIVGFIVAQNEDKQPRINPSKINNIQLEVDGISFPQPYYMIDSLMAEVILTSSKMTEKNSSGSYDIIINENLVNDITYAKIWSHYFDEEYFYKYLEKLNNYETPFIKDKKTFLSQELRINKPGYLLMKKIITKNTYNGSFPTNLLVANRYILIVSPIEKKLRYIDENYTIAAIDDGRRGVIKQGNEIQGILTRVKYRVKWVDNYNHLSQPSNEDYIYVLFHSSPLKEMVSDIVLLPKEFALYNAYPNPFNPTTNIRFDLPERSQVTLIIYDLMGREIKRLIYSEMNAGFVKAIWNGTDKYGQKVASGVYLYTFTAKSLESDKTFTDKRKMVLMK